MKYPIPLLSIFLFLFGCSNPDRQEQKNAVKYFDVKGYIEKEALHLTRTNPTVTKTVIIDGSPETKNLKITDWKDELSIISDADINRASWKGAFTISKLKDKEIYRSDDQKIPVKEVTVIFKNNKPAGLLIFIKNSNMLYTSADSLSFYPDSIYQVKKSQKIKLLSPKNYTVTTRFK